MKGYVLSPSLIHDCVFRPLEKLSRCPTAIFIHPVDYADIHHFGGGDFDVCMEPMTSLLGTLWGVDVRIEPSKTVLKAGRLRAVDDRGSQYLLCLHCRRFYAGATCNSESCVIREVQES